MRLSFLSQISGTIDSLRSNRSRNLLTILGISIGAFCIATVLALTNGAQRLLVEDLSNHKVGTILIRPVDPIQKQTGLFDLSDTSWLASNGLPESDLQQISSLPDIASVTPLLPFSANLISTQHTTKNDLVVGTTPSLIDTFNLKIKKGQFLEEGIVDNAAVIGRDLSLRLFDMEDCVGQTFQIRGTSFVVVGVLEPTNYKAASGGINYNQSVIINYSLAKTVSEGTAQIRQINIMAKPQIEMSKFEFELKTTLLTKHLNEENFNIISSTLSEHSTSQTYKDLSSATLLFAFIALLVGGVGVMNIMLVNVAEQTHEIGIRRALGATGMNIVSQFLAESAILCLLGGLTGLALSYFCTFLLKSALPFNAIYNYELVAKVLTVTVFVGLIAGMVPAIKATIKNPIESLRQF